MITRYRKTGYKNIKKYPVPIATFIIPANALHPTIYINNRGRFYYSISYASHKRIVKLFSDFNKYDMSCDINESRTVYRLFKYRQLD